MLRAVAQTHTHAHTHTHTRTHQTKLKDGAVVEINGFMPGLKLKKVLATISEDLLHEKRTFRSMRAHAAFVAQMVLRSRVQAGLEDEEAADTDAAMVDDLALDDDAAESEGEGEGRSAGAGGGAGKRGNEEDGVNEGEDDSGDDEAEAADRMQLDAVLGGEAAGGGCQPREGGARGGKVPREVKNLGLDSMYSERERDAEVQRQKLVRGGGTIVGSLAKGKTAEEGEGSGGRATRGMLSGTWGLGRRAPTEIYLLIHNIESQVKACGGARAYVCVRALYIVQGWRVMSVFAWHVLCIYASLPPTPKADTDNPVHGAWVSDERTRICAESPPRKQSWGGQNACTQSLDASKVVRKEMREDDGRWEMGAES